MPSKNVLISAYDVAVPALIYGTAWKKEATAKWVQQAIESGFRGIDTACQPKHYNEAGVGAGIANCIGNGIDRADLYLQTKYTSINGHDPLRVPYDSKVSLSEQVTQSCQVSLANLQTSYLDCLLLHSPLADQQQMLEVWRAMESLYYSDEVKQLGLCNCYDAQQFEWLYHAVDIKPAVIQNRFYADTHYDQKIRSFCQQHNVIYQSFWTLTANPGILADKLVQELAEKYQCSAAQLFFRYLTQIGIVPLTGTTSVTHMLEDLAIFSLQLTASECKAVASLLV